MKTKDKLKFVPLLEQGGNWVRVVRHCPHMTRTYINDIFMEVKKVAFGLGGKSSSIDKPNFIFDDQNRQWVCVKIRTSYKTPLNKKIITYDGDMNFSDVSEIFKKARTITQNHRFGMNRYDGKSLIQSQILKRKKSS